MLFATVIIPTYNERENLEKLVESIFQVDSRLHILVIDDNSPDGTGELADQLHKRYPNQLNVIHRKGKLGLGTAYIQGFQWTLEKGSQYILQMDADFSHDPKYIPDFLQKIESTDLVLGSRYIPGGGVVNWGLHRKLISKGGSLYSRMILGLPFKDLTGGFKCFRKEVLNRINLNQIQTNGYAFQIEMTYQAFLHGFKIAETPIIFVDRYAGKSKMSKEIFLEAVVKVWKLRFRKSMILRS